MRARILALAAAAAAIMVPSLPAHAQVDLDAPQRGSVVSGSRPIRGAEVILFATGGPGGRRVLGRARTGRDGTFEIAQPRARTRAETRYLIATGGSFRGVPVPALRFATVLAPDSAPSVVTLNELTTVATSVALAQFIQAGHIDGPTPGLPNAAATLRNLVSLRSGGLGRVLREPPNGSRTPTLATFQSMANLLAGCVRSASACDRLFALARHPGGRRPGNTMTAAHDIATAPWHNVGPLFGLSLRTRVYRPALTAGQRPDAWTLALRYDGGGGQMDGPGQAAFDRHGNAWITNNYVFTLDPLDRAGIACGDDHVLKLRADGRNARGAPYEGGGLYGAGYGVTIGRDGSTWVSNFGFQGSRCPNTPQEQSSYSKSLSQFAPDGSARSPDATASDPGGWAGRRGLLFRPQGMATDRVGDIWTASCGSDELVVFRRGDPDRDAGFGDRRLDKPFDVTVDPDGRLWVTGNGSDAVVAFDRRGRVVHRIAGDQAARAGIRLPMAIASDSRGNIWLSNSGILHVPCDAVPDDDSLVDAVRRTQRPRFQNKAASMTMIRPNGRPHPRAPFKGAGLILPWGVAIDGNDTVWVANFDGKRLSNLCGARTARCPVGKRRVGAPISPSSGYGFAGLVRNTGVAIDPSGNVWLANNWRMAPNPANPGGHQMVVFLGLAEPVRTPLIGAPRTP